MSRTICVYCGSQAGQNPAYREAAENLGSMLAAQGFRLVYGGGSIGLMGSLARSMLAGGGEVIGIIPQALLECEVGLIEASELIVTTTMRERKAMMDDYSDAFVALPGGFGTLEELMETVTLRQLGYHAKPVIIVNIHGYYDPLLRFFDHAVEQGYVSNNHPSLYSVVDDVHKAVDILRSVSFQSSQSSQNGQNPINQSVEIQKKIRAVD